MRLYTCHMGMQCSSAGLFHQTGDVSCITCSCNSISKSRLIWKTLDTGTLQLSSYVGCKECCKLRLLLGLVRINPAKVKPLFICAEEKGHLIYTIHNPPNIDSSCSFPGVPRLFGQSRRSRPLPCVRICWPGRSDCQGGREPGW